MPPDRAPWLVVIDLQHAFADAGGPWFSPTLAGIVPVIADLVPLFGERTIFTRFVPPAPAEGSWIDYYGKWPFADGTQGNAQWNVIAPWSGGRTVSSHTFSKWTPDLVAITGPRPTIVLCGVTTDCCVLATAFAAVDAGAHVRVVEDACTANSAALHEAGLMLLRRRAPQLAVLTAAQERRHHPDRGRA